MANSGLADFGDLQFSGTFGWENNEIHRRVWLNDPKNQLLPLLQELFGVGKSAGLVPNIIPSPFPSPFGTFRAFSISFSTKDKGAQGDVADPGNFSLLNSFPNIRGGVECDITYRPMERDGYSFIEDEVWDFTAQTMSLIGNNYGTNPSALMYKTGPRSASNLTAAVKVIPKVDFVQKRIYCMQIPSQTQMGLIGGVNAGPLTIGAAGYGDYTQYPEECVLLVGMPAIRRWRFDGLQIFEINIKLAINTYQDFCADLNCIAPVTWNRIYNPSGLEVGWDRIGLLASGGNHLSGGFPAGIFYYNPLYPQVDLGQVVGGF